MALSSGEFSPSIAAENYEFGRISNGSKMFSVREFPRGAVACG
jgi:hypothetical protein